MGKIRKFQVLNRSVASHTNNHQSGDKTEPFHSKLNTFTPKSISLKINFVNAYLYPYNLPPCCKNQYRLLTCLMKFYMKLPMKKLQVAYGSSWKSCI